MLRLTSSLLPPLLRLKNTIEIITVCKALLHASISTVSSCNRDKNTIKTSNTLETKTTDPLATVKPKKIFQNQPENTHDTTKNLTEVSKKVAPDPNEGARTNNRTEIKIGEHSFHVRSEKNIKIKEKIENLDNITIINAEPEADKLTKHVRTPIFHSFTYDKTKFYLLKINKELFFGEKGKDLVKTTAKEILQIKESKDAEKARRTTSPNTTAVTHKTDWEKFLEENNNLDKHIDKNVKTKPDEIKFVLEDLDQPKKAYKVVIKTDDFDTEYVDKTLNLRALEELKKNVEDQKGLCRPQGVNGIHIQTDGLIDIKMVVKNGEHKRDLICWLPEKPTISLTKENRKINVYTLFFKYQKRRI